MTSKRSRRQFLHAGSALVASGCLWQFPTNSVAGVLPPEGFRSLFDGQTLTGWHPMPRSQGSKPPKGTKSKNGSSFGEPSLRNCGRWTVQDGVIVGEQDPPGSGIGGYLVSDEAFGDFELLIDAKPDWSVDTGVLVRTTVEVHSSGGRDRLGNDRWAPGAACRWRNIFIKPLPE